MSNSQLINRIFGKKKRLSRQDIDNYRNFSGNRHELEEKIAQSSFESDAMEGWESVSFTTAEGMKTSDDTIRKNIYNIKNKGLFNSSIIVFVSLFSLTLFFILFFTIKGNNLQDKLMVDTHSSVVEADNNSVFEDIQYYTEIDSTKQVTIQELIGQNNEQTSVLSYSHLASSESKKETDDLTDGISLLPYDKNYLLNDSKEKNLVYQMASEVYLHSFKNVDYRNYRSRPIPVKEHFLSGVPASQSSSNEESREVNQIEYNQISEIPYIDYLTDAVYQFGKKNYRTALGHYLTILETYPDDINANFYGGLCYYNLGQFEKSIELLRKSYSISFGNFREEALWFIAKANYEQGKDLKAKYVLRIIVNEKGFYSERAQNLLNSMD